jgi:hypothetical protein
VVTRVAGLTGCGTWAVTDEASVVLARLRARATEQAVSGKTVDSGETVDSGTTVEAAMR